jgi:hypothetical protein
MKVKVKFQILILFQIFFMVILFYLEFILKKHNKRNSFK